METDPPFREAINYIGRSPSPDIENREPKHQITPRANAAREMYFNTKSSVSRENLGKCMGLHLAYPDMVATKCADFAWFRKN